MDKKGKTSESLSRGLSILELLGVEDSGYTLKEIADRAGMSKTSAHRYVTMLCDQGYLLRSPRSGLYRLGVRTLSLSLAIVEHSELVHLVKPLVDEAGERFGVHIDVGLLAGDAIYLIYRRDSKDTRAFRSFSYSSALHYLATGKAAMPRFSWPSSPEASWRRFSGPSSAFRSCAWAMTTSASPPWALPRSSGWWPTTCRA